MTDREIIDQLKSGEGDALSTVYQAYRSEFMNWLISRYQSDPEQAKDHYQFAILKLYENILSGKLTDLSSSIKTYLFAIGKNKALEAQKASHRFVGESPNLVEEEVEREVLLKKEEQLNRISECLKKLGNPCEAILKQFYYNKKSMDEIAEQFHYNNRDTAKNLKFKCLQRLRKLVNEQPLNVA